MSDDREAFLRALAADEDDVPTRSVYADWLDEQGEHEEADRQRLWPAAKAWLVRFCQDNNPPPDEPDPYEYPIPYEELIERARSAVERAAERPWLGFSCATNETMCCALRSNSREFWKNWSVVTGVPLPPDAEERSSFSCAC
jgi:uncharacterized protein (TIGR02996 family)